MTTYRAWNLKPLDRSALKELTAAIAQQSTEEGKSISCIFSLQLFLLFSTVIL